MGLTLSSSATVVWLMKIIHHRTADMVGESIRILHSCLRSMMCYPLPNGVLSDSIDLVPPASVSLEVADVFCPGPLWLFCVLNKSVTE